MKNLKNTRMKEEESTTYVIKTHDKSEMQQLIHASEAYSLLWEIDQYCRQVLKYEGKETRDEALGHIRRTIGESEIMRFFE